MNFITRANSAVIYFEIILAIAGCSVSPESGSMDDKYRLVFAAQDRKLHITNIDGRNQEQIGAFDATLPRVSPNGEFASAITYTSYLNRDSLVLWNFKNKVRTNLASIRESSTSSVLFSEWSPDGLKIVFVRTLEFHQREDLFVVDVVSGITDRLTDEHANKYPMWSADSKVIWFVRFFTRNDTVQSESYLIDADGKNLRLSPYRVSDRLTATIRWRPDNKSVVFAGAKLTNDSSVQRYDIFIMGTDGGQVRQLTSDGKSSNPTWSPNGELIAYTVSNGGTHADLYVMKPDGSSKKAITNHNNVIFYELHRWSSDGRKIAYMYSDDAQTSRSIHVVDVVTMQDVETKTIPVANFDWYPVQ